MLLNRSFALNHQHIELNCKFKPSILANFIKLINLMILEQQSQYIQESSQSLKKLQTTIQNKQALINTKYEAIQIIFYFRLLFTVYILIYCIVKLFVDKDFDLQLRLFSIPFLIASQVIWNQKAYKMYFEQHLPSTWILQSAIYFFSFLQLQSLDIVFVVMLGIPIVLIENIMEFTHAKVLTRSTFSLLFIALYVVTNKFHSQEMSSIRLFVQLIVIYPLFGGICGLVDLKTKHKGITWRNVRTSYYINQTIFYSQLLRNLFLAQYKYVPTLLLVILIIQCLLQLCFFCKNKHSIIFEYWVLRTIVSVPIYPNKIKVRLSSISECKNSLVIQEEKKAVVQEDGSLDQSYQSQKCSNCATQRAEIVFHECLHCLMCRSCAKKMRRFYDRSFFLNCGICKQPRQIKKRYELTSIKDFFRLKFGKRNLSQLGNTFYMIQEVDEQL